MDPKKRFSLKAQVYARHRPDFAPEAIVTLCEAIELPRKARVVDIGAGTGMLTRHLLAHFDQVIALEPNPEMLATAAASIEDSPGFQALAAQAEAIPLAENSMDLITAGRVLHWLQPEPTRAEFRRVAKVGAWLVVARLQMLDETFLQVMRELRTPENGFRHRNEDPHPGDVPIEFYFAEGKFQTITIQHTRQQGFSDFVGGQQSGSYAPDENHPRYENFLRAARAAFDRLSIGENMTLHMATEICYGKIL